MKSKGEGRKREREKENKEGTSLATVIQLFCYIETVVRAIIEGIKIIVEFANNTAA